MSSPPRAAASGAEQVEDLLERRRAVGVVDDDCERLAGLDALHPTRHTGHRLEPASDGCGVETERLAEGDDGKRVVDVEAAGEPEVEPGGRSRGVASSIRRRLASSSTRVGADVGARVRAVRDEPRAGLPHDGLEQRPALGSSPLTIPARGQPIGLRRVRRRAGEALEQRKLGRPVRLERAVELEVLVGQVREDRDVVRDAARRARRPARGTSSRRTAARSPALDHRPERPLELRGLGRRRRAPAFGSRRPPIFVATVPTSPTGRMPAASSAATARKDVVVLPSVPVMPTTPSSRMGRRTTMRPPSRGPTELRSTTSWASGESTGRSTIAAAAPAAAAAIDEVVAVDVLAGHGDEQRSRADRARVVRHAPERRPASAAGPIARPRRGPAQLSAPRRAVR